MAADGAPGAVLELDAGIAAGRLECRKHAEGEADQRGEGETEAEYGAVHGDRAGARQAGRSEGHQRAHAEGRHDGAERAAEQREDQALGQQLADEPPVAGTQRGAERELAPALNASGEQQVGHVDAGDHQHQGHGGEEREERRLDAPGEVVPEGVDGECRAGSVGIDVELRQGPAQRVDLARGLIDADARLEPCHGAKVVSPGVLGEVVLHRGPQRRLRRQHVLEPPRHHADDDPRIAVEHDGAPDDRAIGAEAAAPERVAEDDDAGAAEAVLGGVEVAAQGRRHAEDVEVAGAHPLALEELRLGRAGHRRPPGPEHGDPVEGARALLELGVHAVGALLAPAGIVRLPDHGDAPGAKIRQRLEQDRVHGADRREGGRRAEPSGGVAQVGEHGLDRVLPAMAAHLLSPPGHAAHLEPRGPPGRLG